MRGFPKTIGTKQDIDNLLAMPEYKEQAEAKLKEIAAARFCWVADKEVDDKYVAAKDEQVVDTTDDSGKPIKMLQKQVEDATAQYFRLGYKAADLADIEGKS